MNAVRTKSRIQFERLRSKAVCFGEVVGHAAVGQSPASLICLWNHTLVLYIAIDLGRMLRSN